VTTEITLPGKSLPALAKANLSLICDRLRGVCRAADEGIGEGIVAAKAKLGGLDALIAATPALSGYLDKASRSATTAEISELFMLLVASKPDEWDRAGKLHGTRKISELWSTTLLDDIASLSPSSGAIAAAGRTLRLTRKPNDFQNRRLPPSSEIVDEIRNAERDLAASRGYLKALPAKRQRLLAAIEDAERFLARRAERAAGALAAGSTA